MCSREDGGYGETFFFWARQPRPFLIIGSHGGIVHVKTGLPMDRGMTAVALGCCACQAAPPASAYNEKLSAAQTTEAPKEEAWEGYVPTTTAEPFRATLSNGAYQLSIDADVVATRAPQYSHAAC